MNERTETILEHMLEDAQDVVEFTKDIGTFEAFSQDMKTRKAVVMSLLNIGELANHLPPDFKESYPDLPWRKMIGMRNLAAHGYHTLHLDVIWNTSKTTVVDLLVFLQEYFAAK